MRGFDIAVWELVMDDVRERYVSPDVLPHVLADMRERDDIGRSRYGTPLQPFNGRDALVDAYQELLDGAVYLRQSLAEVRNSDALSVYTTTLDCAVALRVLLLRRDSE